MVLSPRHHGRSVHRLQFALVKDAEMVIRQYIGDKLYQEKRCGVGRYEEGRRWCSFFCNWFVRISLQNMWCLLFRWCWTELQEEQTLHAIRGICFHFFFCRWSDRWSAIIDQPIRCWIQKIIVIFVWEFKSSFHNIFIINPVYSIQLLK